MKYGDDEIIWSGNLENLYNFYKIPLLYKYIYFSQEEINNNILFSYAYNDDSQKDTEFINKIQNYKSSKIEINKSLKISEPLEKFKVSEYYIYFVLQEFYYIYIMIKLMIIFHTKHFMKKFFKHQKLTHFLQIL
jgi:hypothetical protein